MTSFWDEKLEAAVNYDETWSEGETPSAGILDADFATSSVVGAPPWWNTKCLRAVSDPIAQVRVGHDFATSKAISYCRMEVIVPTGGFPTIGSDLGLARIASVQAAAGTDVWVFGIQRRDALSPNGFNWYWAANDDGGGLNNRFDSSNDIVLATPHRLECKWNATTNKAEWRVGGIIVGSEITLTSTHPTIIQNNFRIGWTENGGVTGGEIFIDNVKFDDAEWVGPVSGIGDGIGRGVGRGVLRGVG